MTIMNLDNLQNMFTIELWQLLLWFIRVPCKIWLKIIIIFTVTGAKPWCHHRLVNRTLKTWTDQLRSHSLAVDQQTHRLQRNIDLTGRLASTGPGSCRSSWGYLNPMVPPNMAVSPTSCVFALAFCPKLDLSKWWGEPPIHAYILYKWYFLGIFWHKHPAKLEYPGPLKEQTQGLRVARHRGRLWGYIYGNAEPQRLMSQGGLRWRKRDYTRSNWGRHRFTHPWKSLGQFTFATNDGCLQRMTLQDYPQRSKIMAICARDCQVKQLFVLCRKWRYVR